MYQTFNQAHIYVLIMLMMLRLCWFREWLVLVMMVHVSKHMNLEVPREREQSFGLSFGYVFAFLL